MDHIAIPTEELALTVYYAITIAIGLLLVAKLFYCIVYLRRRIAHISLLNEERHQKSILRRNMLVGYRGK